MSLLGVTWDVVFKNIIDYTLIILFWGGIFIWPFIRDYDEVPSPKQLSKPPFRNRRIRKSSGL